jgi:hypothetical protein
MTLPSLNLLSRTSTPTARTDVQLDLADVSGLAEHGSESYAQLGADKMLRVATGVRGRGPVVPVVPIHPFARGEVRARAPHLAGWARVMRLPSVSAS